MNEMLRATDSKSPSDALEACLASWEKRFRALRSTPGGVWERFPLTLGKLEFQNFHILAGPGPDPGRPWPGRPAGLAGLSPGLAQAGPERGDPPFWLNIS